MCAHASYASSCVKVRGLFVEVDSVLPLCGTQGLSTGHLAWWPRLYYLSHLSNSAMSKKIPRGDNVSLPPKLTSSWFTYSLENMLLLDYVKKI